MWLVAKKRAAPSKSNHGNIIAPIRTPSLAPPPPPPPCPPSLPPSLLRSSRPFHLIRRRVKPFGAMRNARTRTRRMLARPLEGDTRSGRMSAHSPDGRLPFVVVGGGGGGGGGAAGKTRGRWPHGTRGNKRRALPGKLCSCFLTSFGISKFSQEEPSASPQGKLFAAPTPLAFLPCLHRSLPSPHNITVMSEWSREC